MYFEVSNQTAEFVARAAGWCFYAMALFFVVASACLIYPTAVSRGRRGLSPAAAVDAAELARYRATLQRETFAS